MLITPAHISSLFSDDLGPEVSKRIEKAKIHFQLLTREEEQDALTKIVDILFDDSVTFSGAHRKKQWERGWQQNFEERSATPHYFGKYKVNRLNGEFVKGVTNDYEQNMLYIILDYVTDKYLRGIDNIYEFGCGTGHNLKRISGMLKTKLHGLDWTKSSQKILKRNGITTGHFDFFHPRGTLKKDSGVLTVAALEQTGKDFKKFVDYLIKQKPTICVHIEPIEELLDQNSLLDNLSLRYFKKRNYLSGFLTYLRQLEEEKKITIYQAKRSHIGSLFIEGYSILVWSPTLDIK